MTVLTNYVSTLRSASADLRAYHDSHHFDSIDPDFIERMFHLDGKIGAIGYVADLYEKRGAVYFQDFDLWIRGERSWVLGADAWFSREIERIDLELVVGFDNEFEALMFASSVLRRVGDFESECVESGSN